MSELIGHSVPHLLTSPLIAAIDWSRLDWTNLRQLIVAVAVLAVMVTIGVYVIGKIRGKAVQKEPPTSELLTKFREMHSQGVSATKNSEQLKLR